MKTRLLLCFAFSAAFCLFSWGCAPAKPVASLLKTAPRWSSGALAPDLEIRNAGGELSRLSLYRGKAVFLTFWASWCTLCEHEIPHLARLAELMDEEDFAILAVSVDEQEKNFLRIAKKHQGQLELWHDYKGMARKLFNPGMLPVTMVINKEGRLVLFPDPETGRQAERFSGPKNWSAPATLKIFEELAY